MWRAVIGKPSSVVVTSVWLVQMQISRDLWGNAFGYVASWDGAGFPRFIEWLDPTKVRASQAVYSGAVDVSFDGTPLDRSRPLWEFTLLEGLADGGLLSFELADGVDTFEFLNRLKIVVLSSNLGDNRTLAIPVAHTIFFEMGAERRASMGIADSLIRVSVGIEDQADLIGDFEQALA